MERCSACSKSADRGLETGNETKRFYLCPDCCRDLLASMLPMFSGAFVVDAVERMVRFKKGS